MAWYSSSVRVRYSAESALLNILSGIVAVGDELMMSQGRDVTRAEFDMCGQEMHRATMDFGEEWWVHDCSASNILVRWQDDNICIRTVDDTLQRPIERYTMPPGSSTDETPFELLLYGELVEDADDRNLRGRLHKSYGRIGLVVSEYDFKGNLIRTEQGFSAQYKSEINWAVVTDPESCLQSAISTETNSFDALSRVTEDSFDVEAPETHPRRVRYIYNCLSLVSSTATISPPTATTPNPKWDPVVFSTTYDALSRKTAISYNNDTKTKYEYDPVDLSLRRAHTVNDKVHTTLQDLRYTYDVRQNITHIEDNAQQDIYFRNAHVTPGRDYTYDAINRLIEASGREAPGSPVILDQRGGSPVFFYTEFYSYDSTGNILSMHHKTSDENMPDWNRFYTYAEPSPLQPMEFSNRLSSSTIGRLTENYTYNTHGNLTSRPGVQVLQWDFQNQLQMTSAQRTLRGATYYDYDSTGVRVRKTTESESTPPTPLRQTTYFGDYEIFRKFDVSGKPGFTRWTLSVGEVPACRVESELTQPGSGTVTVIFRFQLLDHLGSIAAELDTDGTILTYFEYSPFGKTVYSLPPRSAAIPLLRKGTRPGNGAVLLRCALLRCHPRSLDRTGPDRARGWT